MSEKTVSVIFNGVCVKVKYTNFENLIQKSKSKHEAPSNCHLEYEGDGKWIKICDDEDLEEISANTELRLVLKDPDQAAGDLIKAQHVLKVKSMNGDIIVIESSSSNQNEEEILAKKKKYWLDDLEKVLHEYAKQNCILDDTTVLHKFRRNAGFAELQMSLYQSSENGDELGHLHTREEIFGVFEHSSSENLKPEDFFQKSKELVLNLPKYKHAQNEVAKQTILSKQSNTIGIIGQAGVGKSTLTKVLLSRMVDDEKMYNADFVFCVKARDFHDKTKRNLFQFLMGKEAYNSINWMKDKDIRNDVLNRLAELDSVCILFDGLDEIEISTDDKSKADVNEDLPKKFILDLLSGQILPKAKKIFTSRPGQMLDLPDEYKPKFIVNILGITQEGFSQICRNICADHPDYADKVEAQIKKQSDLYSYSTVPIHCILIVNCIYESLINPKIKQTFNTITDVFLFSYYLFTKSTNVDENPNKLNVEDEINLKKLCSLAWSGTKNRKILFDDEDLKHAGLSPEKVSSFVVTVKRLDETEILALLEKATVNCTYFSHLLFQEFFAAIYCVRFMTPEKFRKTFFESNQLDLTSNRFSMVTKFLFGLLNSETCKTLEKRFNIFVSAEHVNLLKKLAIDTNSDALSKQDGKEEFPTFLRVYSWLFEIQDQNLVQQISNSFPDNIWMRGSILPNDLLPFGYVLKARTKEMFVSIGQHHVLNDVKFYGNALELFCIEMENILTNHLFIKIKKIDFSLKKIDDETAKHISHLIVDGVEEMNLTGCDLSAQSTKLIASRISKLTNPLIELNLSHNENMDLDGYKHLSKCLNKIQILKLMVCAVTKDQLQILSEAILDLTEPMKRLYLFVNPLPEDERDKFEEQCQDKVEELWI